MVKTCLLTASAIIVDAIVGDPRWLPHPVVVIGKWIDWADRAWNRSPGTRPRREWWLGIWLTMATVVAVTTITWFLLFLIRKWSLLAADIAEVWLISTTIAWKGLIQAGRDVYQKLTIRGLEEARVSVSWIVGRDTDQLSEPEVVRATVETLAENLVDAIVAPALFGCLGGAPLAMAFRAVNTLDSMVGYKNDRYLYFGWASARLDDVLNYIPARLTAPILWAAVWLNGGDAGRAWRTMRRDARKHPSPNSGIPEAMIAGALGVQLGGQNSYGGVVSVRNPMGDATLSLEPTDIVRTASVVNVAVLILLGMAASCGLILWLSLSR